MPENERAIGIFEPCRFADGFLVVCDPMLPQPVHLDQVTVQDESWLSVFRGNEELIQRSYGAACVLFRDNGWRMYGYQLAIVGGVASGLQKLGAEMGLDLEPIVKD